MKDAGILDGDLLVVDRAVKRSTAPSSWWPSMASKRLNGCGVDWSVCLDPANPKCQPLCVSMGEESRVFGVVRHAIHRLR